MNSERKAFEEWANTGGSYGTSREYHDDGSYDEWDTQAAWKAWQASANRQGYKLVPVEPTDKMMHSALMTVIHKNGDVAALYKAMIGAVDD